jgi:CubicO group peptidase (beta-lactamase class C family)
MDVKAENIKIFEELAERIMERQKAVGIAIAVFNKAGNTLYDGYFGLRDKEQLLTIDTETIFGLASVTKSFTSLAIMQLYQRGAIDINAPISTYIPKYVKHDATVAHLMTHSAGYLPQKRFLLNDATDVLGLVLGKNGDFAYSVPLAEYAGGIYAQRLSGLDRHTGRPGENFSYSNDSYALLGEIVRLHGGERTYAEYIEKNILVPLDMRRSGNRFIWDDPNVSRLYMEKDGKMRGDFDFTDNATALPGNGSLKSTISDMKKYVHMYLNDGKSPDGNRIIGSYEIREMQKPRIPSGLNTYYGYGLRLDTREDLTVVSHSGSLTGVSSNVSWSHEAGIGAIVLCNTSNVSASALGAAAMRLGCGKTPVEERDIFTERAWSTDFSRSVSGEYVSEEGPRARISQQGRGFRVIIGEFEADAFPINSYTLRARLEFEDMLISILLDADERVWAVRIRSRILPRESQTSI